MKKFILLASILLLSCNSQPVSAKPITNIITENTFTIFYEHCFNYDAEDDKKYAKRKFGIELKDAINYRLEHFPIGDKCEITYYFEK